MADKIETIDGSVIQHGFHNDRIYLMHLHGKTTGTLIPKLDRMAKAHGYGKIFAKIPADHWHAFKLAGYTKEAVIPSFFDGHNRWSVYRQIFFSGQAAGTKPEPF